MRKAGYEPRVRMDVRTLSSDFQRAVTPRVLYNHRCPICDTARTARRAMRAWRCRACWTAGRDGKLEIARARFPIGNELPR
jgi:ribosomal protein L37AE/L43A